MVLFGYLLGEIDLFCFQSRPGTYNIKQTRYRLTQAHSFHIFLNSMEIGHQGSLRCLGTSVVDSAYVISFPALTTIGLPTSDFFSVCGLSTLTLNGDT